MRAYERVKRLMRRVGGIVPSAAGRTTARRWPLVAAILAIQEHQVGAAVQGNGRRYPSERHLKEVLPGRAPIPGTARTHGLCRGRLGEGDSPGKEVTRGVFVILRPVR